MYMRFVHLKVREGRMRDMARFFEDRIIPALEGTKGCLYASLLQPSQEDQECVSMTMWRSQAAADDYEKSGLYDELLDDCDDLLADSSEWNVRLTGDPKRDVPQLQDPDVESYPVEVAAIGEVVDAIGPHKFFIRVVAARIEAGKFDELKERYDQEVKPALMATKGCRAVFLVDSARGGSRALSVTVWDSEEEAIRYELSGGMDKQVAKVSEFFSGLYQWKLSLDPSGERAAVTGKDLEVKGFQVVTGRRIKS